MIMTASLKLHGTTVRLFQLCEEHLCAVRKPRAHSGLSILPLLVDAFCDGKLAASSDSVCKEGSVLRFDCNALQQTGEECKYISWIKYCMTDDLQEQRAWSGVLPCDWLADAFAAGG